MTAPATPFPLAWPLGWPRTPAAQRVRAQFSTTKEAPIQGWSATQRVAQPVSPAVAMQRLQRQIEFLGAKQAVLSSNLESRLDGFPRSGQREPSDPGVALYFILKGKPTVMPCDKFTRAADNITAIAHHISSIRAIERYGVGTVDMLFTGFQAVRGPGPKPWREVLGFRSDEIVTPEIIADRHRVLIKHWHPDVNRAAEANGKMVEVNTARDDALRELRVS